jgi:Fe-S oxidoreductase
MEQVRGGAFAAAYRLYAKSAVFPGIVSHICDAPCEDACARTDLDGPLSIRELELICWRRCRDKAAGSFFIPQKNKKVLIVGGGLCGMTCAAKLAGRGYSVTLAERSGRLGGRLWELDSDLLPRSVLEADLDGLAKMPYLEISLDTPVSHFENDGFDAALVAIGEYGDIEEKREVGGVIYDLGVRGEGPLDALRRGSELSFAVESYIKVGAVRLQQAPDDGPCSFAPVLKNIRPADPVTPADPASWTDDEARTEAGRCILCDCNGCIEECDMFRYYNKDPRKALMETSDTVNKTQANTKIALRQILSCTACGLCEPACPEKIDFRSIYMESRRIMHKTGHLPDAHYDFWLSDMAFSNGDAALSITPPGSAAPRFLYFPGCQMGASDPEYVTRSYRWLRQAFDEEAALELRCCGAPAFWAGDEALHEESLDAIRVRWRELDGPMFILPCPTCLDMFKRHLPEIGVLSLWEAMAESFPVSETSPGYPVSIFDPCSSKYSPKAQESVRTLVKNAGCDIEELPSAGESARCCGYGGLIYSSNPKLVKEIQKRNAELGERDYVTYCTNCRESLASYGKGALHVLDVALFDPRERRERTPPGLTERRANRVSLKKSLMKEWLGLEYQEKREAYHDMSLDIPGELREKMNRELIHEDNVRQTVHFGESADAKVFHPERDSYTCHLMQGTLTFWVEYRVGRGGEYVLLNVYKHRMSIEE